MAETNFALSTAQKKVWARDVWSIARNNSFAFNFMGDSPNAMIQRLTELTRTERGDQAVMTLVPDLEGDGTMGDYDLEGFEEAGLAYDLTINIDQIGHAMKSKGKMSEQKSIVNFRKTVRDVMGYWLSDRIDQMAFLTLAGIPFTRKNNGGLRPVLAAGHNLSDLAFAADVSAPTSARHLRWSNSLQDFAAGDVTAVVAADVPTYRMLVLAKAYAKEQYIKGISGPGGQEIYHVFVTPTGMAKLKLDPDYIANVRYAFARGEKNPLFAGTTSVMADGLIIHEFRHVYNTLGATTGTISNVGAAGYKWGATAAVKGQRIAMCGAQALGFCDLGSPEWYEKDFDYGRKPGISLDKILGFRKPKFQSPINGNVQDFGVLSIDTAI